MSIDHLPDPRMTDEEASVETLEDMRRDMPNFTAAMGALSLFGLDIDNGGEQ